MKIRQQAATLDQIRDDHVNRYRFAANFARRMEFETAMDIGCGVGYGSKLLADKAGLIVLGFDRDAEAVEYAQKHYAHKHVQFHQFDIDILANAKPQQVETDLLTAFEVIEHTPAAFTFLNKCNAEYLVGSVPNEKVVPFNPEIHNKEHYRHFTPDQIVESLSNVGWKVIELGCQPGKRGVDSLVTFDATDGRTLVFVAKRETVQ